MSEILYLLSLSALDTFFRNLSTGQLSSLWLTIGLQNSLVQMSPIRLIDLLKLHKIVQVSFAEYNSKRDFV